MPHITPSPVKADLDVVIIGSGGEQMAYSLTLAGLKCVMLEAGRSYDPLAETPMFQIGAQAPLRGSSTPDKNFGFFDVTVNDGWQVPGEPYTQSSNKVNDQFIWSSRPMSSAPPRVPWACQSFWTNGSVPLSAATGR